MPDSQIVSKDGVEYPTRTTAHNQVVAVKVADPSDDTMQNYLQLKRERECSWDDVASNVAVQNPALADHLRSAGPGYEEAQKAAEADAPELLTELAVNPLISADEREAALKSGGAVPTPTGTAPVTPANSPEDEGGASVQAPDTDEDNAARKARTRRS